MVWKRMSFIAVLLVLFAVCFYWMNQSYDPLARYPYADDADREILLEYLDQEDINYLITQQIKPEEIMPFIAVEGFDIANTRWYSTALQAQEDDVAYIVNFINEYRSRMTYSTLEDILTHYSYSDLIRYFETSDDYDEQSELVTRPDEFTLVLNGHKTVFSYEPSDLTLLEHLPVVSTQAESKGLYLRAEAATALQQLMEDATEINGELGGGLTIERAYTSFESQVALYEQAVSEHGEQASWFEDMPGESEYQLGYTVSFALNDSWEEQVEIAEDGSLDYSACEEELSDLQRQQISWLRENAYRYGFVIRFEEGKEAQTQKAWQPFTLRYVGVENARTMHEQDSCMEEMNFASS